MDINEFMGSLNLFDLVVVLFLFAMFILGFAQGTVRRIVGILSIVFSFFVAAQLSVPVGTFLADNWTQYPRSYSVMIGFLAVFVAAVLAFSLVIQGTYQKTHLFSSHPIVDEILGGVLGIVQGLLVVMFLTIILDQFFLAYPHTAQAHELPVLREVWTALNTSGTGQLLHQTLIPDLVSLTSFLIPASVRGPYGL